MPRTRHVGLVSALLAMLCAPLAFSVGQAAFRIGQEAAFSAGENRMLAPPPGLPTTARRLSAFPGQADAFLRDHLGLREWMTRAYATIRLRLLRTGNGNVLLGERGWLFYRGEDNLQKSAGLARNVDQIERTAAILAAMQRDLVRQGGRLLVAVPPNNATIAVAGLPAWAQNPGVPTQYDLMLEALADRAVPALDLRPSVRAAALQGPAYHRHDTHWTPRGAIAAVNAILDWSDAGWRVDPAAVLGPPAPKIGGDEAKMLGLEDAFTEQVEPLLPAHRPIAEPADQRPYRETGLRADGRRILILGDSFTYSFFAPVLRQGVREVMWLPFKSCYFDWSVVLDFHPDEVWWMPTERLITCPPSVHPRNLAPLPISAAAATPLR